MLAWMHGTPTLPVSKVSIVVSTFGTLGLRFEVYGFLLQSRTSEAVMQVFGVFPALPNMPLPAVPHLHSPAVV